VDRRRHKRISKFLSYVLRHHPGSIGIELDEGGWAEVSRLLRAAKHNRLRITLDELRAVVKESDKQRFSFSEDGMRIRANQGHSIPVDLGYDEVTPPKVLYHGTAHHRLDSIRRDGLLRGSRHHVHLSTDRVTAKKVGQRYGKAIVIEVQAGRMHSEGYKFYLSANKVWLTEYVPPSYLKFPETNRQK
jgi:putative RNA 2'-phosphotransferase